MQTNHPIKLPSITINKVTTPGAIIEGAHPIVIIGPNGSGKTTQLSRGMEFAGTQGQLQKTYILAQRVVALQEHTPHIAKSEAERGLANSRSNAQSTPHQPVSDIMQILAKLLAENSEIAVTDLAARRKDPMRLIPPETNLDILKELLHQFFPGRSFCLDTYTPKAVNDHFRSTQEYSIQFMSDGERAGIDIIARVLDAPPGLIFIDEPELHLHHKLSRAIYDELQVIRQDCRFIYITHDLAFALSRKDAQIIVARKPNDYNVLPKDESIPAELIESVLGAASFSVNIKNIIFCEGDKGGIDEQVYSAWLAGPDTVVTAVGGCTEVEKCVTTLNADEMPIRGLTAFGIVDGDFRVLSANGHSTKKESVHILRMHEIENLICSQPLFMAVCLQVGITEQGEPQARFQSFVQEARKLCTPDFISSVGLRLAKHELMKHAGEKLSKSKSLADALRELADLRSTEPQYNKVIQDLHTYMVDCDDTEFVARVPGKSIWGIAAKAIGITKDVYLRNVLLALRKETASTLPRTVREVFARCLPDLAIQISAPKV